MSGSVVLTIETGQDWGVSVAWTNSSGDPLIFDTPRMDIRQELSPTGNKIASLDASGNLDGLLTITEEGVVEMRLSSAFTALMPTGRGFWDLFVNYQGQRVRLVFGTVNIKPHVTAAT